MVAVDARSVPIGADRRRARPAETVRGRREPRLWTRPLRRLTRRTSYGYAVIDFARDVLREPLDPWQEWAVIHLGELLPDGRPRFRVVLILVARQAGKTHLCKVLALYWLFVEAQRLVLGQSTNISYAQEPWLAAVETAEGVPALAARIPKGGLRLTNGEQQLRLDDGCRYKIAASNRRGGRGLALDRLIIDELREHADWLAWNAASYAMNARPAAQAVCISNQGDDTAVVLDGLRDAALRFIEDGDGDERLGLLEWSAPDGADPLDPVSWAMANPNLGHRQDVDGIAGAAARAVRAGGAELAGFLTEALCIRVRLLDPAVDPTAWARCLDEGTLDGARDRVALCLDLSPDLLHATLVAAARLEDGRVRVEVVRAWDGEDATSSLRRELAPLIARVKPRVIGWMPLGPAAALTADLAERRGRAGWPPRGVTVEPIRSELTAVAMGFAEAVASGLVAHSGDPLLDAHVGGARRLRRGDAWVFSRGGEAHVDAAYAAAGAVHLARTAPAKLGKPRVIVASDG